MEALYKVVINSGECLAGDIVSVRLPWTQGGCQAQPEAFFRGFNKRLNLMVDVSSVAVDYWGQMEPDNDFASSAGISY